MKGINKQFLLTIVAAVSIAIGILAASGGQPPVPQDRVTICHRPGSPARKTLTLPRKEAERHIANHRDTSGACSDFDEGIEVTQTFSDLEPTQPRPDEVTAPSVDLDSSFAPPGPPVPPGPAATVDSHFWEEGEINLEASSAQSSQLFNSAALNPGEEGGWLGPNEGVPQTGEDGSGNVAIHAALLRTGKTPSRTDSGAEILWFAGDVNDNTANAKLDVDHTGKFIVVNSSLPIAQQFKVERLILPSGKIHVLVRIGLSTFSAVVMPCWETVVFS